MAAQIPHSQGSRYLSLRKSSTQLRRSQSVRLSLQVLRYGCQIGKMVNSDYQYFATFSLKVNSANRLDKRENTIWLETGGDTALPIRHYFAFETKFMMTQFEGSFNKCIYSSVFAMQVLPNNRLIDVVFLPFRLAHLRVAMKADHAESCST